MKSFLLTGLLLVTLLFSCGNDDDNDGASMDLTADVVGTYNNQLYVDNIDGILELEGDTRVVITKVSDTEISVNITFPTDPDLLPISFNAMMSSRSAFTIASFDIFQGVTATGSGTFMSDVLVINLTDSESDTYRITGNLAQEIPGTFPGRIDVSGATVGSLDVDDATATVTRVSNTEISVLISEPGTIFDDISFNATMTSGTTFTVSEIMWEGATFSATGTLGDFSEDLDITFSGSVTGVYEGSR
ncbi:MAG: hypothetical protein AAFO91_03345 [Bacteroidota bacterium]